MAGHSHWNNIHRTKGVADAKRGKVFSKLSRYIMIAAKAGGGDTFEVTCDPSNFTAVQEALANTKIEAASTELTQIAKTPLDADVETQQKVMKLMEMLDDHDDVQNVYTNLNITAEATAALV